MLKWPYSHKLQAQDENMCLAFKFCNNDSGETHPHDAYDSNRAHYTAINSALTLTVT